MKSHALQSPKLWYFQNARLHTPHEYRAIMCNPISAVRLGKDTHPLCKAERPSRCEIASPHFDVVGLVVAMEECVCAVCQKFKRALRVLLQNVVRALLWECLHKYIPTNNMCLGTFRSPIREGSSTVHNSEE